MKTRSKLVAALVLASSLTLLTLRVLHSQSKGQNAGPETKKTIIFSSSKASIDNLLMTPKEREIEFGIPATTAKTTPEAQIVPPKPESKNRPAVPPATPAQKP